MSNSPESMLATVLGLLCSTVPAHVHAPNIPLALRNVSEAQWQKELLSFMPEITNRAANSHPPTDPSVLHGHIESSAWFCALEHNTHLCAGLMSPYWTCERGFRRKLWLPKDKTGKGELEAWETRAPQCRRLSKTGTNVPGWKPHNPLWEPASFILQVQASKKAGAN